MSFAETMCFLLFWLDWQHLFVKAEIYSTQPSFASSEFLVSSCLVSLRGRNLLPDTTPLFFFQWHNWRLAVVPQERSSEAFK